MAAELRPFGFERVGDSEMADLYLINTCTVTHRADRDCRNYIRKAAQRNPNAKIVVAGCYVDYDPQNVAEMDGVDAVLLNAEKDSISEILSNRIPEIFDREPDRNCSTMVTDFFERNRAWLKISDGCNQWCTFCIIPKVRGRLKHRPALEIINEINRLVECGYKEVVLTGVNIGYYHDRKGTLRAKNLAELCRKIFTNTGLHRLRLSSIESQTVGPDLLEVYASANGRFCRHFHIPMQSGSSRILGLMQRPYDREKYIRRLEEVKKAKPNTIIGGDVIAGFPGETEVDYEETKTLACSGLLDYLHVFSYSDRQGTVADAMPTKADPFTIRKRCNELNAISNESRMKAHNRQIGEILEVIPQYKSNFGKKHLGVADNYIKVNLPNFIGSKTTLVKIKVNSAGIDYVQGELVEAIQPF
jgi:threonylcarbamoyladenosine tRNA methylthiotransferase MtaB